MDIVRIEQFLKVALGVVLAIIVGFVVGMLTNLAAAIIVSLLLGVIFSSFFYTRREVLAYHGPTDTGAEIRNPSRP